MKNIYIVGAGGAGRETAMLIESINTSEKIWNLLGFIDDDENLIGKSINGYPVCGNVEYLNHLKADVYVIVSISAPHIKEKKIAEIHSENIKYTNLIHPSAIISNSVKIGVGVIVQAMCVITTNVKIGNHVQINPQCGIGHDSRIDDFSSLYWNVNVSGNVQIGVGCLLGTKTTIIQGKRLGPWSITGANTTVIHDLPGYCTAVGSPSRIIKERGKEVES